MTRDRLGDLFEDLEAQAEGLYLAERDAEIADRSQAEYARVTMAARLHASLGADLDLDVTGLGRLAGRLARVGSDWCLLTARPSGQEWVVRLGAVTCVRGSSPAAVAEAGRPVPARLGLRSALREMAEARACVVLWRCDGTTTRGRLARVGADFVEVCEEQRPASGEADGSGSALLLPFSAVAAVTPGGSLDG